MSSSSRRRYVLVRLLATIQGLIFVCASVTLVARDQRANPVTFAAATSAAYIVDTAVADVPARPPKRTTRSKPRQTRVVQGPNSVPPSAKAAGLTWPVRGAITSPFGPRGEGFHHGLDIGCFEGWDIRAARGGTVVAIGEANGYGYTVLLDHGNGYQTLYSHLSSFDVVYNQRVKAQQVLGECGETGNATGTHLHFEVRYGGFVWDPQTFLP